MTKEVTYQVPLAATTFFPIIASKHRPRYDKIVDDGYRGNASQDQAWYQGVGWTEIDWANMNVYPDDTGHFLMGLFGVDGISGGGPYTHTITLLNTALTPSYTGARFTGLLATADQIAGIFWDQLTFKFVNPGKFTLDVRGKGIIQGQVAAPANVYSAAQILLPWQGALTLAGSANAKMINGSIIIKRDSAQIFGMANQQGPTSAVVPAMEITGKMEFWSSDHTELNYYLNNTQPAASLLFTSGVNTWTFQMSKIAFEDPTELDFGTQYARLQTSYRAIANSTDAGTGNAPGKIILVNNRSTAY
jgi:hypothetical protein